MRSVASAVADPDRLAVLHQVYRADRPPGIAFDHLTRLASRLLHAPVSLVTFVDAEHEIVGSAAGLPESWTDRRLPLKYSFCKRMVASGEPLVLEDAREHRAVRNNPSIRELGVVAYAGAPVRTREGCVLGGFCVIDHQPRAWVEEELDALSEFAEAVSREIDHHLALVGERDEQERVARRVEEELASASRFRMLVERSLAGIYLVQDDRILYVNPRLREIFGYDPDDTLAGLHVSDIVAEEDRERVMEKVRLRMEGQVLEEAYGFRALRKDGSTIEVEVHGSRTEIDGEPAIIGTLLDVTRRKRAEEALREAAERLRMVERATEDVVWEWDVRAGTVRWNETGPRMFRYRPEEVGSEMEWHHEQIHPDDRERVVRSLQAVLEGVGEFWSEEYRFRRGDGRYLVVLDRGYVVRDGRGEPVRMIGSMMDVTERRREEEAQRFLSRASALLDSSLEPESLLESLAHLCAGGPGDACVVDLEDGDGVVRRIAAAHAEPAMAGRLLRANGEEKPPLPEDAPVRRVLRSHQSIFVPACDAARLASLGFPDAEREALCGDGTCSLIVAPLNIGDRTLGGITLAAFRSGRQYTPVDLLLAEDLAHRTALAVDHARLYQQAREAVRARDEVLGVVSHDLRNPLSAIQMSAAMIRDVGQERRSENKRWLDTITRTAAQMSTMIDDLLDVSSMEAGRFSIEASSRRVSALVEEARDLLEGLAHEKEIRFETRVDEDLATVWVDPNQILRVLSNLLGNAVKFTPEGGGVTLAVERRGTEVLFTVSDTGPGIPQAQLPHVFDRYWQARPGDRRGAGLGLAIAKGIVEAHGGRIWAESEPEKGATFSFVLPVERVSSAA